MKKLYSSEQACHGFVDSHRGDLFCSFTVKVAQPSMDVEYEANDEQLLTVYATRRHPRPTSAAEL